MRKSWELPASYLAHLRQQVLGVAGILASLVIVCKSWELQASYLQSCFDGKS